MSRRRSATLRQLPFSDATFDVVTSRFGVMFFADVQRSLAEVKRVLKPGGSLVLMVWGQPVPVELLRRCSDAVHAAAGDQA